MHQLMLTGLPFRLSCVCNQNAVYEKTGEYYHKHDGDASQIFDNFLSVVCDTCPTKFLVARQSKCNCRQSKCIPLVGSAFTFA